MKKEVIYIDIEDDITQVIEKVKNVEAKIVAVVLPKRFPVLQSSVNMKLLKRNTDKNGKKVVLVTTDKGLLPLAGAAGVYVAEGLKSRPYLPESEIDEIAEEISQDPDLDPDQPIGVLDGDNPEEYVEEDADNSENSDEEQRTKAEKEEKIKKAGFIASIVAGLKTRGVKKVPDFNRSRKKFILIGVFGVLLIGAWFYLFQVLPSAKIAIQAKTTKLPTSLNFEVDPKLEQTNIEEAKLAGVTEEKTINISEDFTPTGEKDIGEKASGTMTVQNCGDDDPVSFPSGTVFLDEETGFRFESTSLVEVPGGTFDVSPSGTTCETPGTADVAVVALQSGSDKNLSPKIYDIENYGSGFTGFGGQMSGGTSEIQLFVRQADVDKAVKALKDRDDQDQLQEIITDIGEDVFVLSESFNVSTGDAVVSPEVGEDANKATVTLEFTYSIVGANTEDIEELLRQQQAELLSGGEQVILESGIDLATAESEENDGVYQVDFQTDSFIGPSIDIIALAEEIANKRYSQAEQIIRSKPGVSEVVITPDPWYVYFMPDANKIEISIDIEEAN